MSPLLSIITVTKAPADGLEATRASVMREFGENGDVEHIIKEWSADPDIQEEIASRNTKSGLRVRLLKGRDTGVFDGMNQALHYATGRWVVFLNAGDWLARGMGSVLQRSMRDHPDVDYLYFDGVTVDADDRREFLREAPSVLGMRDFFHRVPVLHPCLIVKRECLANGFDSSLDLAADFDLMVRLVAEKRVGKRIPEVGAFVLSGGLSERYRLRARWQATRSLLRHSRNPFFSLQVLINHLRFILIHFLIIKLIRPVPFLRRWARTRSGGKPAGTFAAGNEELQANS